MTPTKNIILMITFSRMFLILCIFLTALKGFSQQRIFSPQLWLSNPKEIITAKQTLNSLNNYGTLIVDANNLNSSISKVDDENHLFLVYRSESPENIISILSKKKSLFLNSDRVKINDSVTLSGYNENYGELLDVKFGGMEEGRFWMNPNLENTKVYELILINGASKFSVNEIRTYLSLKYGIDLIDPKQYEYNKQKLWDSSDKKYGSHIFGIAKLSAFSLVPNNTVHSKDQDLHISINSDNKKKLQDGSFILFGHNNKGLTFNKSTKQSNKSWQVQTNIGYVKLDVSIPLSKLQNVNASYKLLVGGETDFKTYSGTVRDSLYVFKNVSFSKESPAFLRLSESISDIELDITNTCGKFMVQVKPKVTPKSFSITIKNDKGNQVHSSKTVSSVFSVTDVSSNYYDIRINYDGRVIDKRVPTYSGSLNTPTLKQTYKLDGGSVDIVLSGFKPEQVEWYKGTVKIGAGNSVKLDSAGSYSVKINGEGDCSHQQQFSVIPSYASEQWSAFPNPLEVTEELNVSFNLEKVKTVEAVIYTIDGKLVKQFNLGEIQSKTVSLGRIADAAGTYMLVVYIDNVPQIQKIILK